VREVEEVAEERQGEAIVAEEGQEREEEGSEEEKEGRRVMCP